MAMIWKLGQISGIKQLHNGINLLPCKNSVMRNIIQRLKSEIAIKKRGGTLYRPIPVPPTKVSKAEIKYQHLDKLSKDYILIYNSSLKRIIKICYHASYIIVIASIFGIYYVKNYPAESLAYPILSTSNNPKNTWVLGIHSKDEPIYLMMGLIILNSIIFWSSRMHPMRIWFNPEKNLYKLVVIGDIPGFQKSTEFPPGGAILKSKNIMTFFGHPVHEINKKKYFILEGNFKTPADYRKLLGEIPIQ